MNHIYKLFRRIYLFIPGKIFLYRIIRRFFEPSKRIAGYLKFKGSFKVYLTKDVSFKILNDDSTVPSLIFWNGFEGYEKCSVETWVKLSEKSSGILDLGANFGLFGLISQVLKPESNVILFEPLERNASRIRRNFQLNKLEANVVTMAVGNKEGSITFFDMDSEENTIGSIDKSFVEKHEHSTTIIPIEVPMTTIDNYVRDKRLTNVDLIKIDVEGADFQTIEGAISTLNSFKPNILIEITDDVSGQKIDDFLNNLNFRYLYYELNDIKGLKVQDKLARKNGSRNFLLSTMNEGELCSKYKIYAESF